MYLKSLKVTGFKSFADRTRLELEEGVTVVVGPNGSGKSNIVDAIAWVMGTQSTKNLRTEKMEDVIFAGTATRPALARAEVSLVFDNESGMLPLDMPEVTVTRRLYRDGSSDYEINGMECRLLDVQELLSDSGVGRHQHVIVGQGRLDGILNAKPEEHRAVIEEAAGILKHRLRKDRSIRRLERTDADVLRLLDIIKELKRQLRPLKKQARDAERFDGLRDEIRRLRLYLGAEELRTITGRLSEAATAESSAAGQVVAFERELAEIERNLEPLAEAAGEAGRALDRDTAAAARLETTMERLRSIAQVAAERARGLRGRLEGADERRSDLTAEAEELQVNLQISNERELVAAAETERTERVLSALESEERSLAEQETMPTEGAVAMVRGDLRAMQSAADRDASELALVRQRLGALGIQIEEDTAEIERLRDEIQTKDGLAGEAQRAYQVAKAQRVDEQRLWEESEEASRGADLARAGAAARVEALEAAAAGLADPAARERAERADAVVGSLSALLDIPAELAAAADAALGTWADALAVRDADGLGALVAELKADGLGGVPLVTSVPSSAEPVARAAATEWGLDALVDLLGSAHDSQIAAAFLGDVLLAEGWSAGWEVARTNPTLRVVTPEGDLITALGIRVPNPEGATPAMVEAAHGALDEAERQAARAASRVVTARRSFEASRATERQKLEDLESLEAGLAGATEALDRITRRRVSTEEETARLETRQAALEEAAQDRADQISRLEERLAALEGEEAERQRAWEALAARRQEVAKRRDEARHQRQVAATDHGAIVERKAMLVRRIEEVNAELADLAEHPVDPTEVERLGRVEQHAKAAIEVVRDHIETLRRRQVVLRERSGQAGAQLAEARSRREELHGSLSRTKDLSGKLAVEMAELRIRHESVAEMLRRDADASEEEALAMSRPELEETDDLELALERRVNELRRMGPVNPLAAHEYAELNERYEFLQAQLDDLEQSRSELKKVIRALDETIQELFVAAFDEVAASYEEYFSILFPGGRGKISLTDSSDPLSTGVDIKAQPLGKKVSRLQLLSGGERSLAALAFLFAVFKARPSPFYIMDEVEAALDDANLRRFLKLVDAFRGSAQLMIITHQQQTMEAADVLDGVTMEPGGSSKVIAKRMAGQLVFDA